jgi:hypothetical protein
MTFSKFHTMHAEGDRCSLEAYEDGADYRSPYDDEQQYVGSRSECTSEWLLISSVWPSWEDKRLMMRLEELPCIPGLLQIFFEALSNAIDNIARGVQIISIKKKGSISVYSDGCGISTDVCEQKRMYVPEWVFTTYISGDRWKDKRGGHKRQKDQGAKRKRGRNDL